MAERKPEFPEPGDLVIATVETVTDYGAYTNLDKVDRSAVLYLLRAPAVALMFPKLAVKAPL